MNCCKCGKKNNKILCDQCKNITIMFLWNIKVANKQNPKDVICPKENKLYDASGKLTYIGELSNGLKSGYGMLFDVHGKCYFKGHFKNNLRDGIGEELINDKLGERFVESRWEKGVRINIEERNDIDVEGIVSDFHC